MKKTNTCFTAFLLLCLVEAKAQSSLNASGGNATGTGGSASYSVGQLAYTTATGTGGNASAGVQQAIEIFTAIRLSTLAFPNPVEANLTLQITDPKWSELRYELIDMSGRTLFTSKVNGESTRIPFAGQAVGTYTLRVVQGQNEIKSFKILKNQ
jgi:hypothetical protein